jgi:hypothetical protein
MPCPCALATHSARPWPPTPYCVHAPVHAALSLIATCSARCFSPLACAYKGVTLALAPFLSAAERALPWPWARSRARAPPSSPLHSVTGRVDLASTSASLPSMPYTRSSSFPEPGATMDRAAALAPPLVTVTCGHALAGRSWVGRGRPRVRLGKPSSRALLWPWSHRCQSSTSRRRAAQACPLLRAIERKKTWIEAFPGFPM